MTAPSRTSGSARGLTIRLALLAGLALGAGVASAAAVAHDGGHPTQGDLELLSEWGDEEGARLRNPLSLTLGPDGRTYVADSGNSRIQVRDLDGALEAVWELPDGSRPAGIALHPDGRLLVTDYAGDRVLVLSADGSLLESWGETGDGPGEFRAPSGVAVGPDGEVVIVEFMGQRVQVLSASGRFLRWLDGGDRGRAWARERPPVAGMEPEGADGDESGNPDGLFVFPSDAAFGPDGTLYVTNTHAYEVLALSVAGEFLEAWGSKGGDPGRWEVPVGIDVGPAGRIWVADSANFRIQALDSSGRPLLVSRAGERWYETTRRIYSPTDVVVAADGSVLVADFAASRVQRFRPSLDTADR